MDNIYTICTSCGTINLRRPLGFDLKDGKVTKKNLFCSVCRHDRNHIVCDDIVLIKSILSTKGKNN